MLQQILSKNKTDQIPLKDQHTGEPELYPGIAPLVMYLSDSCLDCALSSVS